MAKTSSEQTIYTSAPVCNLRDYQKVEHELAELLHRNFGTYRSFRTLEEAAMRIRQEELPHFRPALRYGTTPQLSASHNVEKNQVQFHFHIPPNQEEKLTLKQKLEICTPEDLEQKSARDVISAIAQLFFDITK